MNDHTAAALKDLLRSRAAERQHTCITFLASHIATPAKLDALRACLQSAVNQSWIKSHSRPALCLMVSWSAANAELACAVRSLLADIIPEQIALEQMGTLSQFDHYRQLAVLVCHLSSAVRRWLWVGFSDDDDIWHPRRVETFYAGMSQVEREPTVTQLRFPWFAVRAENSSAVARSTADVDSMLARGAARLWNTDASEMDSSEHWTAIARFALFDAFLAVAPPKLLANRFADLAWERFSAQFSQDARGRPVVEGGESVMVAWTADQPWMYFYNVPPGGTMLTQCQMLPCAPDGSHSSGGGDPPTAEDRTVASQLLARVPRLLASQLCDEGSAAEERIARRLAHLRRNLSVTVIQRLWPLRHLVTAEQMVAAVVKDLERTWQGHDADAMVEDYILLDASKPLRALLGDMRMQLDAAVLFEAHCRRLADAAIASARCS